MRTFSTGQDAPKRDDAEKGCKSERKFLNNYCINLSEKLNSASSIG